MKYRKEYYPKARLEKSAFEMVKAARRLAKVKRDDHIWAGTCDEMLKRLTKLEKLLHKQAKKSSSEAKVREIAKELASLIGNLCKSLIRYLYHFQIRCYLHAHLYGV